MSLKGSIIQLESLNKSYGLQVILEAFSLQVESKEFISILGPSGSGKSTILKIISGFEPPDAGQVLLRQTIVSAPNQVLTPPEKRNIGLVFQEWALFPHMTVAQNVEFGLKQHPPYSPHRVQEVLELVGMAQYQGRYPHELSGGEQQRVAIARALAPKPDIVLLDEPFSSLDLQLRIQLRQDIRHILKSEQVTALLVTHDQSEAFLFGDQVVVMNEGRVQQQGTPKEIYQEPANRWVAQFVGNANFLSQHPQILSLAPTSPNTSEQQLMVRPEDVLLTKADKEDATGFVTSIHFEGEVFQVCIELTSGQVLVTRMLSEPSFQVKDSVKLTFQKGRWF